MQVLIGKDSVGVKRCPEEQQEKRSQNYLGRLWLGAAAVGQDSDQGHKRHNMQQEQRIGNRVFWNLDVPTKLEVQLKVLIQCPQTISRSQEEPERPVSKRVVDSVSDRKSGGQHQKKEIADPAVGNQERSRLNRE